MAKRLAAILLERKETREAQAANWEQLKQRRLSQAGEPKFAGALKAWPIDVGLSPVCASNDEIEFCTWAAPALVFAKKVLGNGDQHVSPKIREFWSLKHRLIHHKDCTSAAKTRHAAS